MIAKTTTTAICLTIVLTLSACVGGHRNFFTGPGHQDFAKQLSWQSDAEILSVQGYIIRNKEDADSLQATWQEVAELMKNKPGFIEADLNPGAANSKLWMEVSRWESVSHLRRAIADPKVQRAVGKLPKIGMSHIFIASHGGHAD